MKSKERGLISLAGMLVLSVAVTAGSDGIYNALKSLEKTPEPGSYQAGTYESSAKGFGGDVKVAVTIGDDGSITDVSMDCSTETDTIGQAAQPELLAAIMEAQSADIDGVSGATMTSNAVKEAVASCLAQASGEEPVSAGDAESEAAKETEAADAAEAGSEASESAEQAEEGTEASEAAEAESEVSEAAETEAAEVESAQQEETEEVKEAGVSADAAAGVYEASAAGFGGDVKVAVTFEEDGRMASIQILDYSTETPDVGQAAAVQLTEDMMQAQSADVDVVSGATMTSTAIKEAVASCMAQAAGEEAVVASAEASDGDEAAKPAAEEETEAAEALAEADTEAAESADAKAAAGVYEAAAAGYGGDVKVAVTFDSEGAMQNIQILDFSTEDAQIGQAAALEITSEMIQAQSVDVDSISGATMTSTAIKEAVASCMAQAAGGEAAAVSAAETSDGDEEETAAKPAAEEETEAVEASAEADAQAASEDGAAVPAGDVVFTAGEYEGVGAGRNGDIKVKVTLSDTGIENVEVLEHEETDGIGNLAFEGMIPEIIKRQTVDVDSVSGATLTSEGLKAAVTDALLAAGIDAAALTGVEAEEEAPAEDREMDADVVIVGAGGAGLAAAASASEEGAKVVVLEKMSFIGGNTTLGEGTYNVADPARQELLTMTEDNKAEVEEALSQDPGDNQDLADLIADTQADYDAYLKSGSTALFDSANWHALQTYEGGGCIGNIPLIRAFADGAVDTLDWLENEVGVPFKEDYIFMAIGGKWARGHQVDLVAATGKEGDGGGKIYIDRLKEYAEERGAEIITDAEVTKLIVDESGAVTGAVAECGDGSTLTVNAPSTILTTGGFAANSELVLKYSDGAITTTMTSCAKSSTGDGIILAEEAGGAMVDLDQIQVHPLGDPINDCGCVAMFVGNWLSATEYVFVNKEGERFVKEDGTRYEMSMAELEQTDDQMWLIVDSSEIAGDDSRTEQIESLIADGHTVCADTLEELAEKIGVDPGVLVATVEKYNEGMKNGKDEFGKATSEDSIIATAPFYASLRTPTVHHTMGGVEINTEAEVLDADGNVIPGLYAAGEATGGIHGNNRLGGNAYPDIMTFGRIAGRNAAGADTAAAVTEKETETESESEPESASETETAAETEMESAEEESAEAAQTQETETETVMTETESETETETKAA